MLSLEEILREGVIPEQQGGGQLQEAATTGQTQVGEGALSIWNKNYLFLLDLRTFVGQTSFFIFFLLVSNVTSAWVEEVREP